jgi:hypothetical protein
MTICVGNSNLAIAMPNHLSAKGPAYQIYNPLAEANGNERKKFIAVCFS